MININTGNPIVDAIGKMNFTGNIIPEAWYSTIVNEAGKVQLLAINILAEIVYWYRPSEIRDEHSNTVYYKKRFSDDYYVQKSYKQLCEKFNISEKQARTAIEVLERLGVVKRQFRTIETKIGRCSNVMYLELIPDALERLTFPNECNSTKQSDDSKKGNSYLQKSKYPLPSRETAAPEKDNTYTESTEEITTKNTTTTVAVVGDLLKPFNLDESDIIKIHKAACGNIPKVESAIKALTSTHSNVGNVVGFLISAIKNSYASISYKPKVHNAFDNFSQRDYDYNEMQSEAISASRLKPT